MNNSIERANNITLKIYVKPRSSETKLVLENDELIFYTKAKPERNEANKSLIRYISKLTGIPTNKMQILSGYKSRNKVILIEGADKERLIRYISE